MLRWPIHGLVIRSVDTTDLSGTIIFSFLSRFRVLFVMNFLKERLFPEETHRERSFIHWNEYWGNKKGNFSFSLIAFTPNPFYRHLSNFVTLQCTEESLNLLRTRLRAVFHYRWHELSKRRTFSAEAVDCKYRGQTVLNGARGLIGQLLQ